MNKDNITGALCFWGMIPILLFFEFVKYENIHQLIAAIIGIVILSICGIIFYRSKDEVTKEIEGKV